MVVGGIITFDKSKENGTFEYSFEPSIGIVGEFGAKTETNMDEIIKKLMTLIKKSRIFSGNLPILNGLINLRPFIDLEVNLVGNVNGKTSVGFSYYAKYKYGWNERGDIKENTSTEPSLQNIFNSFELKGRFEIGPEATISTGCGLYTTDIALSLNTKPSIMVGAELGASGNGNGIGTKIEDQKVTLDVAVDLEGNGKVSLLGKNLFAKDIKIANWNLFNKEWPLFPFLLDKSFKVEHRSKASSRSDYRSESSEIFEANYSLSGGLMTKIMKGKPAIRVEKDGKEVYTIVSQNDAFVTEQTDLTYELSNLEKDVKYRAYPCIAIEESVYKWEGLDFSYSEGICPDDNHPHMIDLGLPSGTKWACCNVGASKPEEYGAYYAWGETEEKNLYDWSTYNYFIGYNEEKDYRPECSFIGDDIAGTLYDVAHVKWGSKWVIPNLYQIHELINNTTYRWVKYHDVEGLLITGNNGNNIILPGAGFKVDSIFNDPNNGCYWTSISATKDGNFPNSLAYALSIGGMIGLDEIIFETWWIWCMRGFCVRPITN